MRVLGIDPGSTVTGFGVVEFRRGRYFYVESGCIRTRSTQATSLRLLTIHAGLVDAIARTKPDAIAIEAIFRHKSSESALRLGQARGVALLACGQAGYEPSEYNPMTVKQTIGASGRAEKDAVARMVIVLLGQAVDGPYDQTDALAIAMTHCAHYRSPLASLAARGAPPSLEPPSDGASIADGAPRVARGRT